MKYENLKIELNGIKATHSFKNLVKNVAENIHWQSPSDSSLKIVFAPNQKAVKASCRIASQAGTFVAEAMADSPEKTLVKLEQQIQKKLNMWKQSRYSKLFSNKLDDAS